MRHIRVDRRQRRDLVHDLRRGSVIPPRADAVHQAPPCRRAHAGRQVRQDLPLGPRIALRRYRPISSQYKMLEILYS